MEVWTVTRGEQEFRTCRTGFGDRPIVTPAPAPEWSHVWGHVGFDLDMSPSFSSATRSLTTRRRGSICPSYFIHCARHRAILGRSCLFRTGSSRAARQVCSFGNTKANAQSLTRFVPKSLMTQRLIIRSPISTILEICYASERWRPELIS